MGAPGTSGMGLILLECFKPLQRYAVIFLCILLSNNFTAVNRFLCYIPWMSKHTLSYLAYHLTFQGR